jgi:2-aminoadipate transaminase
MGDFPLPLNPEIDPLKRSVMRDLLALAVDPGIISLAGGLPASEMLPIKAFSECLQHVLERDGPRALQYSPQHDELKTWIAEHMRGRGVECDEEQVFITNGAQQGLAILSRLFLPFGGPAVIEQVTFTGIQQATVGRGAAVRTIPTDLDTGVDVDALEQALRRTPPARLVVLIPDFHNPLGVSMSEAKRARAASIAAEYRVPLIEDDPYSMLRFDGAPLAPIKAHDPSDVVFYLGSFSKILAPAVRLGWIVAPKALIPKITVLRESMDLESSTLIQRAIAEFLVQGKLEPHLERLRGVNRERCEAMLHALDERFAGVAHWTKPEGGLFVWVTLPERVDTWELFKAAVENKVAYIPGAAFAVQGDHRSTMRLNFSNATPEAIQEAIARLSEIVLNQPALTS